MPKRLRVLFPCCLPIMALPAHAQEWNPVTQLANGGIGIVVTGTLSVLALRAGELAATELRLQQQKAYALNVVATIAPIVGLLGTVIGMIESFHVIAANGMGDPSMLAGGISKALVNTAAGLSVALPALAMHHVLRSRLVGIALERQLNRLLDDLRGGAAPQAPADTPHATVPPMPREASHAH